MSEAALGHRGSPSWAKATDFAVARRMGRLVKEPANRSRRHLVLAVPQILLRLVVGALRVL